MELQIKNPFEAKVNLVVSFSRTILLSQESTRRKFGQGLRDSSKEVKVIKVRFFCSNSNALVAISTSYYLLSQSSRRLSSIGANRSSHFLKTYYLTLLPSF